MACAVVSGTMVPHQIFSVLKLLHFKQIIHLRTVAQSHKYLDVLVSRKITSFKSATHRTGRQDPVWKVDGRARAPTASVRAPLLPVPMRARQTTRSRIHWHPTLEWRVSRGDLSPTQQPKPDPTQASQPADRCGSEDTVHPEGRIATGVSSFLVLLHHVFSHCPNECMRLQSGQ